MCKIDEFPPTKSIANRSPTKPPIRYRRPLHHDTIQPGIKNFPNNPFTHQNVPYAKMINFY